MQISVPYHRGDADQAQKWLDWTRELGGTERHQLFLMPAKGAAAVQVDGSKWNHHEFVADGYGIISNWNANDPIRDASGPNSMFRQLAWFFEQRQRGAWMFCEPDAIPIRATWLDELEAEYIRLQKPYMGAIIPGVDREYVTHATGNGIYPQEAAHNEGLMIPQYAKWGERTIEIAFDVAGAKTVLRQFASTHLIQQIFRGEPFRTATDLARIHPGTAIFHTDKTGSLVDRLREKRNGVVVVAPPVEVSVVAPETPVAAPLPSKPTVNTFCSWSSDAVTCDEQNKVLTIWRKNWTDAGWNAVLLTEDDARRHPRYEEFRSGFAKLPIKNPLEYEMACFMRWVAMAAIPNKNVNLLVDYDVLTNGFPFGGGDGITALHCFCQHVPCATCGRVNYYERWCERFIEENAQSDMHCLEKLGNGFYSRDSTVAEYGKPDYESAKLIHFAHFACAPLKRSQSMQGWVDYPEMQKLSKSIEIVQDVKYHVGALAEYCKRDGFAKGRVRKALKAAKIIA